MIVTSNNGLCFTYCCHPLVLEDMLVTGKESSSYIPMTRSSVPRSPHPARSSSVSIVGRGHTYVWWLCQCTSVAYSGILVPAATKVPGPEVFSQIIAPSRRALTFEQTKTTRRSGRGASLNWLWWWLAAVKGIRSISLGGCCASCICDALIAMTATTVRMMLRRGGNCTTARSCTTQPA